MSQEYFAKIRRENTAFLTPLKLLGRYPNGTDVLEIWEEPTGLGYSIAIPDWPIPPKHLEWLLEHGWVKTFP